MRLLIKLILLTFTTNISVLSLFAGIPLNGIIISTPEYPGPNQRVTLELNSLSFDVNSATIIWYNGGKKVLEGIGKKTFSITTGAVGSVVSIGVLAKTSDDRTFATEIFLSPVSTLLLTEAVESYIPPFYEGRALPGEGSRVKVIAFPTFSQGGKKLDSNALVYAWSINDQRIDSSSGYGERTMTFRQDELDESSSVQLITKTADGTRSSESRLTIAPYDQAPRFYISDPILGLDLAYGIDSHIDIKKETKISLVPYFFTYDKSSSSSFSWSLNGLPIVPEDYLNLNLIPKQNSSGSSDISVSFSNKNKQLQDSKKNLQVSFDTTK